MTYRVRNIVLAVALAALAALLVTFYVANYKKTVQSGEKNVTVFVATKEIAAGTSGGDAQVARRNVVPGATSNLAQLEGKIATEAVYPGEQVTLSRFKPVQQSGVLAGLTGNQRAFQLAGDPNQMLIGTLKAGDRVDVLAAFKVKELLRTDNEEVPVTRTALRDILVLSAPGGVSTGSKLGASQSGSAVQLAVTDAQARKLFFITQNGAWHLTLRPVVDPTDTGEGIETVDTLVCDGLPRAKYGFCRGGV